MYAITVEISHGKDIRDFLKSHTMKYVNRY